ncbi:MAG TPA: CotH kinase family protein [Kofleriaceae bacterium]|nr:CotH kinase family protein [Kofleriaceae bacterium]
MRRLAAMCAIVALQVEGGCGSGPEPVVPDEASEALFDPTRIHEIDIDFDGSGWDSLHARVEANTYYHADVVIDGHAMPDIGVRSRGNGTRNPIKPGLKLDFNAWHDDRRFGKLKNVVLENFYGDHSCLHEHLSFQVFQALGIESPRTSFARVTVDGAYAGLYGVVEAVDKPFLRGRLGDGNEDGNLFEFEVMWFSYDLGKRPSYVPMPFEPKTHEEEPDSAQLTAFMDAITDAPADGYAGAIAAWIDPEHVLTYYAAEVATVQIDGLTGVLGVNNFFIYQRAAAERFVLIPWDRDFSFHGPDHPIFYGSETNVLIDRLLADPDLAAFYLVTLQRIVADLVDEAWLIPRLEEAYELIHTSVVEDPVKPYSDVGIEEANARFEEAVETTRTTIQGRAADVAAQIAQTE